MPSQSRPDRIIDALPPAVGSLARRVHRDDLLFHAAGLAFYALVSAAPLAIVAMWIVSLMLGDERVRLLADRLRDLLPAGLGAGDALRRVAEIGTSAGVGALFAGLWPATAYGGGLSRSFEMLSPKTTDLRGLRGRGLALVVLLPAFVFGGTIAVFVATSLVGSGPVHGTLGWVLAFAFGFGGAAAVVAPVYILFGPSQPSWRRVLRGTIVASATIAAFTLGYAFFLQRGADFEQRYASSGLAGIVLLGVWLFAANAALLFGYMIVAADGRPEGFGRRSRRVTSHRPQPSNGGIHDEDN